VVEEQPLAAELQLLQIGFVDLLVFLRQRCLLPLRIGLARIEPQLLTRQARDDRYPLAFPVGVFVLFSLHPTRGRQ